MEVGKIYKCYSNGLTAKCIDYISGKSIFKGLIIDPGHSLFNKGQVIVDLFISSFEQIEDNNIEEGYNIQIGGEHYKKHKIQPTEFIYINNIPFIEGNIIKYVIRHRDKNGLEDLKKAKHYIELLIQMEYENPKKF